MEKKFKSFEELLDFDFSSLEPQASNYIRITPINGNLPKIREEFDPKKWRIVERHNASIPGIIMEITPRWLTITIHRTAGSVVRRMDFPILKKDPKAIIRQIFEV